MSKIKKQKITRKTKFSDLIKNPELVGVLLESGMHCIGCPMAMQETIEQGAFAHGINPDELVKKLNKKTKQK